MATIEKDKMVTFDYVLSDENGNELDSSKDSDPLSYIHGYGQIVSGLEKEMTGKQAGDKIDISVPPEEGYGEPRPELVLQVPKDRFDFDVQIGQVVQTELSQGAVLNLQITAVSDTEVTLDGNHPLAGKTLHFNVTVKEIRQATDEELASLHNPQECCGNHQDGKECSKN